MEHPAVKRLLRNNSIIRYLADAVAVIGAIYLVSSLFVETDNMLKYLYERITIGRYIDINYGLSECDRKF